MKTMKFWLFAIFTALIINTGCQKEDLDPDPGTDPDPVKQKAPELTIKVNTFISDIMTDIYLWYKELPVIDINYEFDSKAYFKKLLYTEDKWSTVTDNVKKLEDSLGGKEKSYGYSLTFGRFLNAPDNLFAIVEYVYPNTPASRAGFMRGDIILQIGGASITATNYMDLLGGTSITITKGVLTDQGIAQGQSLSMVAEDLVLNPVLIQKVIEHGGRKIGYLMYAQFISDFNDSLTVAMQNFKSKSITDLVLDLRYNPGGYTAAAQHLCSSIAPLNVVNNSEVLVSYQWNDKYQAYWQSRNNQSQLKVPFLTTVPVKLGLNKLHILTGSGTASASELTIIGLEPYMEIITVGDTTYGKYTASFLFAPSDIYSNASQYKDFENWGVMPVAMRYANSQGVTNFKNGFAPKFVVRDELLPALPLGSINEPLLKKAIENITGTQVTALKRAEITMPPYEIIDRGFSEFDEFKRNLPINDLIDPKIIWPNRR